MRIILFTLVAALFASVAFAQDVPTGASGELRSSSPGTIAILRGLDKISAKTRDFEAPVNSTVTFGTLRITVNYCRKTPPEEKPEVYVFMNIKDRRTDGSGNEGEEEEIFSGWMFASNPALNALEHPVYDVWVLDCKS
jgi:hypothetical protein